MQEFKSPVSRLARLFQKGRDSWKEKALDRQKKLRTLEIKESQRFIHGSDHDQKSRNPIKTIRT